MQRPLITISEKNKNEITANQSMLSCRRLFTAFRELEITKTYPFARRLLFCQSPVLAHSKHSLRPRLAAITSRITRRGYGVMGFVREDRIQCVLVAINELNRPGKKQAVLAGLSPLRSPLPSARNSACRRGRSCYLFNIGTSRRTPPRQGKKT